jgi:hypothetical protein
VLTCLGIVFSCIQPQGPADGPADASAVGDAGRDAVVSTDASIEDPCETDAGRNFRYIVDAGGIGPTGDFRLCWISATDFLMQADLSADRQHVCINVMIRRTVHDGGWVGGYPDGGWDIDTFAFGEAPPYDAGYAIMASGIRKGGCRGGLTASGEFQTGYQNSEVIRFYPADRVDGFVRVLEGSIIDGVPYQIGVRMTVRFCGAALTTSSGFFFAPFGSCL